MAPTLNRCFSILLAVILSGLLSANPSFATTSSWGSESACTGFSATGLLAQEARQIIETPDTGSLLGYRDRTILEVFYATGIRKAELMALTPADVNLDEGLLRINQGKGGKDRVVPLTQLACSFLKNYSAMVRPELLKGGKSAHLFISQRGGPLSRNALGDLVLRYARQAGVKKHATCHVWRHSCATHLLKNKANLRHVQELLGHRQLSTTERYLHLTITDLKEAHQKHHPREQNQR
jgi:integrase/recombinase XerD